MTAYRSSSVGSMTCAGSESEYYRADNESEAGPERFRYSYTDASNSRVRSSSRGTATFVPPKTYKDRHERSTRPASDNSRSRHTGATTSQASCRSSSGTCKPPAREPSVYPHPPTDTLPPQSTAPPSRTTKSCSFALVNDSAADDSRVSGSQTAQTQEPSTMRSGMKKVTSMYQEPGIDTRSDASSQLSINEHNARVTERTYDATGHSEPEFEDESANNGSNIRSPPEPSQPNPSDPEKSSKPQPPAESKPQRQPKSKSGLWASQTFNSTVNTAKSWLSTARSWRPSLSYATWGVLGGAAITGIGASTAYMTGHLGEGGLSSVALATATGAAVFGAAGWAYDHDWRGGRTGEGAPKNSRDSVRGSANPSEGTGASP